MVVRNIEFWYPSAGKVQMCQSLSEFVHDQFDATVSQTWTIFQLESLEIEIATCQIVVKTYWVFLWKIYGRFCVWLIWISLPWKHCPVIGVRLKSRSRRFSLPLNAWKVAERSWSVRFEQSANERHARFGQEDGILQRPEKKMNYFQCVSRVLQINVDCATCTR